MKKKESKKPQIILSVLIVVIMVSSVIGFMFGREDTSSLEYNMVKFYQRNFKWITQVNGKEVEFHNFPASVDYLNVSDEIISRFKNTFEVDATYDENNTYAEEIAVIQHDMGLVLGSIFNIYVRQGMTEENDFKLPVISCEDATLTVPVIYFRSSNQTSIYLEGDCVIAEAKSGVDFLRLKDRLMYGILGII